MPALSDHLGVIEVRKLVALDLVFHGARFILVEFVGAIALLGGLALLGLHYALSTQPGHPIVWALAISGLLAGVGLNYVPMLVYACTLIAAGDARHAVARELARLEDYRTAYQIQGLLLLVCPLAAAILATRQSLTKGRDLNR